MSLQKAAAFFKSYLFVRIVLNAIFLYTWIGGTVSNFNRSDIRGADRDLLALHAVLYNGLLLVALYINTLVFIPRFLRRKRYLLYTAGLLFSITLFASVLLFYREYVVDSIPGTQIHDFSYYSAFTRDRAKEGALAFFFMLFYSSASFTVIQFSLVFLGQHFFIAVRQNELIKRQQIEIELAVLKSQINPHFLFNVLNSIYSLSLKKSDQTPEVVMRLSEILRYMLYEAKHELVSLEKEVQMVRDYADIEQMRLSKEQALHLNCREQELQPYRIAPLLLIPFVENAIKHGTDSMACGAYVTIDMGVADDTFYFSCRNNYKPLPAQRDGGLGLRNVRQRLQLLYPGRHALDIRQGEDLFEVDLSIRLSA